MRARDGHLVTSEGPRSTAGPVRAVGLLLAAGAGTRYGRPKALVDDWAADRVRALREGGCDDVVVVLGAQAEEARPRLPRDVEVVVAEDWRTGMGASLRAGLAAAGTCAAEVAVVVLVDTPGLTAEAVARVLGASHGAAALVQAVYDGAPGHPVVLGREHWAGAARSAQGDQGARGYLGVHDARQVECGDLGDGVDVDERPEVSPA